MNNDQWRALVRVGVNTWLFCGNVMLEVEKEARAMGLKLTDQQLFSIFTQVQAEAVSKFY